MQPLRCAQGVWILGADLILACSSQQQLRRLDSRSEHKILVQGPGQQVAGAGGAAPGPANGGAHAAGAGAGARPAAPTAGAGAGPTGRARPRGFVQEMQALVVGFFTSLLPGDKLKGFFFYEPLRDIVL